MAQVEGQTSAAGLSNLPAAEPKFCGRSRELTEIREKLVESSVVAVSQRPAPHLLGGVGKSSLAVAFAHQFSSVFAGGTFYVNSGSGILTTEIAKLADGLGIAHAANHHATAKLVLEKLAAGPLSLLILDDLESSSDWNELRSLAELGNCRVLITTRQSSLDEVEMMSIDGLDLESSVQMLAAFRVDAASPENQHIASDIAKWMDGYPMGLSLVGAYMAANSNQTWPGLRDHLTTLGFGQANPDYVGFCQNLFDEFLSSLDTQHRLALEFAALLPTDRIMANWIRQLVQSDEVKQLAVNAGHQVIGGQKVSATLLSLQIFRSQAAGYKIVALPAILRAQLRQREKVGQFLLDNTLELILGYIELRTAGAELALENAQFRNELTSLCEFCKSLPSFDQAAIGAKHAIRLAPILHRLGRYREVHSLLDQFLASGVASKLNPETCSVLMSNKAVTLVAEGDAASARRLMERTIEIDRQILPPNHPTLAKHYSNLAGTLKTLGELDESRKYIQQAIEIEESHYGNEHPTLGLRHWWLGDIEIAAGQESVAETEYQRAHDILSQHCPPDHPHLSRLNEILEQLNADTNVAAPVTAPSDAAGWLPLPDDLGEEEERVAGAPPAPEVKVREVEEVDPELIDEVSEKHNEDDEDAPIVLRRHEARIEFMRPTIESPLHVHLAVRNGQISPSAREEIFERLHELNRSMRWLKVFHVAIDCKDADVSLVQIRSWGTGVIDRDDAHMTQPEAESTAENASVVLAVEQVLGDIARELKPKATERRGMRFTRRHAYILGGVLAVGLMVAAVVYLILSMPETELSELNDVELYFSDRLRAQGFDPEQDSVHIPLDMANEWYSEAIGGFATNSAMIRRVKQGRNDGELEHLRVNKSKDHGQGLLWSGNSPTIDYSLMEKFNNPDDR